MPDLTPKQRRFVAEYLVDLNATQAAIRAGYSPKTAYAQGFRLLKNAEVQAAIEEGRRAQQNRLELRADDVLREFMRVGFADISLAFGANGQLLPLHEIPEDTRRAIAGVEAEELWEGRGEERAHVGTLRKVKFWNKNEALTALGKHLKLFTDVLEAKVDGLSREERAARAAELLAEARARKAPGA